jgi:beta-fructofuranosidase
MSKWRGAQVLAVTSIEKKANTKGTFIVRTLGIEPDPRLEKIRKDPQSVANTRLEDRQYCENSLSLTTSRWELKAEFSIGELCKVVGIEVEHDSGKPSLSGLRLWFKDTF